MSHTKTTEILNALIMPILLLIMLALMVFSLTIGRYPIPAAEVIRIVLSTPPGSIHSSADSPWVIVEIVRLPRILLVVLCGMGLALAGAAMQGVFRNPLVGPEVVGVSAGATFGGILAIMIGWSAWGIVSSAFVFGTAALVTAFLLAKLSGRASILGIVLSGVIISAFFGALSGVMHYMADPETKLPAMVYWLMGSFAEATYEKVSVVSLITLIAGGILISLRWRLNLLSLGESDAASLGVNVEILRWGVVALVSLIVAAQVSVSGGVGWVGLVIPHFARMIVGADHTRLLPVSALIGGIYLLLVDDLSRSLMPQEIPIGLLTALIGTPIFAVVFWKMSGKGWSND
ncbi:iron ABC transporter permease [uncultured Sulfuricurvum sp.]|uniref:FecCD family ABC transporter permease n=1 Tax=uncultured Sulfuricurvum sp. TaxID=430693 RepID=UPI0026094B45|nr:iron ABC transporter permease [uncultured Sulfuricurvum sp.]